jgi:hypothetical protein
MMVVPRLSSKNKGSYLDQGPSQEQIDRRNMIKYKLSLDAAGDDDIDSLAGDDDYIIQLSEAPSTPSRSSRARRLRSASPQNIRKKQSPAPLRRSKSSDGDAAVLGSHSTRSQRTSRLVRESSLGSSSNHAPKRSSSLCSFAGVFNLDKSEHRIQSAHIRTPSSSSRRTRREGDTDPTVQQIICLGKSYRNSLSLDDDSDDEIEHSRRNSSRRTRTFSPTARVTTPKRSMSLGSTVTNSFKKNIEGGTKKFQSLLKTKRDKQNGEMNSPSSSSRSAPRRIKSLGRSRSGDVDSVARFQSPTRSSSWDGPGWNGSPRLKLERRKGIVPCVPSSPSSSHHRRFKVPLLDKDIGETDETLSSAPSKEEIMKNAVRRTKERQLKKHQLRELERSQDISQQQEEEHPIHAQGVFNHRYVNERMDDPKSPSKSTRSSSIFSSVRGSTESIFPKRPSQQKQSSQQQSTFQSTHRISFLSTTSHSSDDDDGDDHSIVSEDDGEAPAAAGTSIFERGLKALEQIYDDLNM